MTEIIHLDVDSGGDQPGASEQEPRCMDLIRRFHAAGERYTEMCLGSIVCGLRRDALDPDLRDALGVAKEVARNRGGTVTCGREICESEIENIPKVSTYVQPCEEYPEGVYLSDIEYGPERPPLRTVPTLPEEA